MKSTGGECRVWLSCLRRSCLWLLSTVLLVSFLHSVAVTRVTLPEPHSRKLLSTPFTLSVIFAFCAFAMLPYIKHARSQIRRLHFIWGKNVGKDQGNSQSISQFWPNQVECWRWPLSGHYDPVVAGEQASGGQWRWESHNLDQEENPNKCTCTCTVWVGHPNRYVLLYTYKKPLPQLVTRPSRQQLPLNRLHTTTEKNNSRLGFSIGLDKSLTWARLEGITGRGVLPTERSKVVAPAHFITLHGCASCQLTLSSSDSQSETLYSLYQRQHVVHHTMHSVLVHKVKHTTDVQWTGQLCWHWIPQVWPLTFIQCAILCFSKLCIGISPHSTFLSGLAWLV